ncbi:hypothetical protein D9M71_827130 [compost metagenome]
MIASALLEGLSMIANRVGRRISVELSSVALQRFVATLDKRSGDDLITIENRREIKEFLF